MISLLLGCFGCVTEDDEGGIFEAKTQEIVDYCKTLVNTRFKGETSNIYDGVTDHNEMESCCNLGDLLREIDAFIRNRGVSFTGNEDEFLGYLNQAVHHRFDKKKFSYAKFRRKILRDKTRFVELYRRRKHYAHHLHHLDFWGTRQQLRAGKVISDWIDQRFGSLDPIFGTLLCPTAGRTGPGDSNIIHELFFDEDGPIAYHSAVHDAFGYLLNYHNTGPGYKYLGAFSVFNKDEPMCEQVAGIEFWTNLLEIPTIRRKRVFVY